MIKKSLFFVFTFLLLTLTTLSAQEAGESEFQQALSFDKQENYAEAFHLMKKSAEMGYSDAMCELASYYQHGLGTAVDNNQAIYWFEKGAESGDLAAMYNLGTIYNNEQKFEKAYKWFKNMADAGNERGMILIAGMHKDGKGVAKNSAESINWYQKAAEKGNAHAMICIAELYKNGEGISKNCAEALSWYQKAANLGNKDAITMLSDEKFMADCK